MDESPDCFKCRATASSQWRRATDAHFDHFGMFKLRTADYICNRCHAQCYDQSDTVSFRSLVRPVECVCEDEGCSKSKRGGC